MKEIACDVLFEKGHTIAEKIFEGVTYPYEVLPKISEFILELGKTLPADKFECREDNIWIAKSASVAPHYNYVGDSVLGFKSHMGAGSITSNVKSDKTLVVIKSGEEKIETGLKKMGAILGDCVEVGCGSILNPGSIIGANSNVYPLSSVRGVIPAGSIYKKQGEVVSKH